MQISQDASSLDFWPQRVRARRKLIQLILQRWYLPLLATSLIPSRRVAGRSHIAVGLPPIAEHHLTAGSAKARFVAAQAGDDLADVRDVAATQPKHIRATRILLRHGALSKGSATRHKDCAQCDTGRFGKRYFHCLFSI
jgi:hypothetical protein